MRGPGTKTIRSTFRTAFESREAIWSWLERDAVVFVCGDARAWRCAAAAFAEIAQTHGGQADGWLMWRR